MREAERRTSRHTSKGPDPARGPLKTAEKKNPKGILLKDREQATDGSNFGRSVERRRRARATTPKEWSGRAMPHTMLERE